MSEWFALTISTVSLFFSCISTLIAVVTALYAFVRRPRVEMTRPTFVAFVYEGPEALPKIFTRALVFATAAPGKVVEAMFARVQQEDQQTTYTFWSYDVDGRLVPGGGLFVGTEGIVTNHHFVLARNIKKPKFKAGPITVTVLARVVGEKSVRQLHGLVLSLTDDQDAALNSDSGGVFFECSPESDEFYGQVSLPPESTAGDSRPHAVTYSAPSSRSTTSETSSSSRGE